MQQQQLQQQQLQQQLQQQQLQQSQQQKQAQQQQQAEASSSLKGRFRAFQKRKGYTQAQTGQLMGVSASMVSSWLNAAVHGGAAAARMDARVVALLEAEVAEVAEAGTRGGSSAGGIGPAGGSSAGSSGSAGGSSVAGGSSAGGSSSAGAAAPLASAPKPLAVGEGLPVHLRQAAEKGDAQAVTAWLDEGGGVDSRCAGRGGTTMLMAAALGGQEAVVRMLLQRGASVNLQSPNGLTALMAATTTGRTTIVQALLGAGAEPEVHRALRAYVALLRTTKWLARKSAWATMALA